MSTAAERRSDRSDALRHYRNLCYAAEHRAELRTWRNGAPTVVPIEGRRLIERVVRENRLAPVTVRFYGGQTGHGYGYYKSRTISVSSRGVTLVTMLHELAHVETPDQRGHGPDFRAVYLGLCDEYLPRYARSLAAAFDHYGLM